MGQTPTLERPPTEADDVERCSPARLSVLAVAGAVVLLASVVGRQELQLPAAPVAAPPLGGLSVAGDRVSVAPGGVFVVPLVLRDGGAGLTDVTARAFAVPVRLDPSVVPPEQVAPGRSRRFVVVLAPDCRMLEAWGLRFRASVLVRGVSGEDTQQLGLHLDQVPAVASAVRDLCRR